ncbi:MAG: hypothetical protein LBF75_06015, partial [Treponema sp.]|nr:hypothetical protein [Treponema sp.]
NTTAQVWTPSENRISLFPRLMLSMRELNPRHTRATGLPAAGRYGAACSSQADRFFYFREEPFTPA